MPRINQHSVLDSSQEKIRLFLHHFLLPFDLLAEIICELCKAFTDQFSEILPVSGHLLSHLAELFVETTHCDFLLFQITIEGSFLTEFYVFYLSRSQS